MKKILIPIALLLPVLFSGCTRELPVSGDELVTVSASISPATRVAFAPGEDAMKLSWEEGDALRILSSAQSELYKIDKGFTAHLASFTGKEVKNGPFTVILPGKYASVADLEARKLSAQVQKGNGSAAHLEYNAVLTGVKDCGSVGFSPEWASANGAEFRESACLRLDIALPAGIRSATEVSVKASEPAFSAADQLTLTLQDVTLPEADPVLTCYLDLGLGGAHFSAASVVTVTVRTDVGRLFKVFRPGEKVLTGGKMYTVSLTGEHWNSADPFAGGSGTEQDPFLITSYIHLNNVASALADGKTVWFKLGADVDMDPKKAGHWDPLNSVSPYDKGIDFDGAGHVIRNLSVNGNYQHGGFVSILNGRVHDVTFLDCHYVNTFTADNNDMGIVSAFAGYVSNGRDHRAAVDHVTVKNCSITTSTILQTGGVGFGGITGSAICCAVTDCIVDGFSIHCAGSKPCNIMGGIVGRFLSNASQISGCRVENADLKGNSFIGGIAGYVNTKYPPTVSECSFNGTIQGNSYIGGVLGASRYPIEIVNCTSAGTIRATGSYCGGILGGGDSTNKAANDILISGCKSSADLTSSNVRLGGIVGTLPTNGNCTGGIIENCEFSGTLTGAANNTADKSMFIGGIAGVVYNATINNCVMKGTIVCGVHDTYYGGITSYASVSTVSNCTFAGKFENPVAGTVGGIAGGLIGDGTEVRDCLVASDVEGTYTVGGVFALDNNTAGTKSVTNNLVLGNVRGVSAVGGVGGRIQPADGARTHRMSGNLVYSASVTSARARPLSEQRSSAAIVGELDGSGYVLSDNYHSSALVFQDGVEGMADRYATVFEQPGPYNASTAPLSWDAVGTYYHPYHGASASETASAKAAALGWSTSVWDLSGSVPALIH